MSDPLHDPFGRSRLTGDTSREERVRLLGEAFEALIEGKLPSPEAARFLGASGLTWLEAGGDLERDHLRVIKRHSHHTPSRLWALLTGRRQASSPMSDTTGENYDDQSTNEEIAE